MYIFNIFICH